jgi:hypothetical protein
VRYKGGTTAVKQIAMKVGNEVQVSDSLTIAELYCLDLR